MLWIILVFSIVQGICEFLPISSSGHIILLQKLFNLNVDILALNIFLHLATALSVIIVYRKTLWELIKKPFSKKSMCLIVATVCSVVIVLLTKPFLEDLIYGKYIAISFLVTAIILFVSNFIAKKNLSPKPLSMPIAIVMGIFQGLAILPGISRSGLTICSGLVAGGEKNEVTDFSFLLSLPIILASAVYEFIFEKPNFSAISPLNLIIAFAVTCLFGILAIFLTKKFTQKLALWVFSIYLLILSVVLFLVLWFFLNTFLPQKNSKEISSLFF